MGEQCSSHDGICEQITETRILVARLEESVKHIPKMADDIDSIRGSLRGLKGFVAGISCIVSAAISILTIVFAR